MLNAVNTFLGIIVGIIFFLCYLLIILEDVLKLNKSKPVILFAGLIWVLVALIALEKGCLFSIEYLLNNTLLEYGKLLLFLFVSMVYINVLEECGFFTNIFKFFFYKNYITLRTIFLFLGLLSFVFSPFLDNLTTTLLFGSVLVAINIRDVRFLSLCCVNIVIASNAGGSFSPFGDLTTLMVWQSGILDFFVFLKLFLPAFISFFTPSLIMCFYIPKQIFIRRDVIYVKNNTTYIVFILFIFTLSLSVYLNIFLSIIPTISMMTGFGLLCFFSYYLKNVKNSFFLHINIKNAILRIDWDTLLFFYGIILSVSGLATVGYLDLFSIVVYIKFSSLFCLEHYHTVGNIIIGLFSSIIDNIPVMYMLLSLDNIMSEGQWLLVTMTTGVGGSLFSIGSASGIALMGRFSYCYNFFTHLQWSWVILVSYFFSVFSHILLNNSIFFLF